MRESPDGQSKLKFRLVVTVLAVVVIRKSLVRRSGSQNDGGG